MSTLLRKLKVLSSRTGATRLGEWVTHELGGYQGAELPPYRGPIEAIVLGHFVGIGGSEMRNVQIPPMSFPKDMRESGLFVLRLGQALAEVEQLATKEFVNLAWPPDAVQYYNYGIHRGTIQRIVRQDMVLASAHRPVGREIFVGVIDGVRNRVLDLALELEQVVPEAGQPNAPEETKGKATDVVNTFNFFAPSNVAVSSSDFKQTIKVAAGDEQALMQALRSYGVAEQEIESLQQAIADDRAEVGGANPPQPGSRVLGWMAKVTSEIGTGTAVGLIVEAVKAFFGG